MLREGEKAAESTTKTIKAACVAETADQQTVYGKFTEDDPKAKKGDSFNRDQDDAEVDSDTGLGEDDESKISSQQSHRSLLSYMRPQ